MELTVQLRRQIDLISPKSAVWSGLARIFFWIPILVRDRERLKEDYLRITASVTREFPWDESDWNGWEESTAMVNPGVIRKRWKQSRSISNEYGFRLPVHEAFLKDNMLKTSWNTTFSNSESFNWYFSAHGRRWGVWISETAYDAAQILFEKGILSKEDVEISKQMIGFRNV